jgi:hypothetical protein
VANVTIGELSPVTPIDPAALVEVEQDGASGSVSAHDIAALVQWGDITGEINNQADLYGLLTAILGQAAAATFGQGLITPNLSGDYSFNFGSTDANPAGFIFQALTADVVYTVASDYSLSGSVGKRFFIKILGGAGGFTVTLPTGWKLDATATTALTNVTNANTTTIFDVQADNFSNGDSSWSYTVSCFAQTT